MFGTSSIEPDTWYHIAGTYDSTTKIMKLYVNGIEERSKILEDNYLVKTTTSPLYLGIPSLTSSHFQGNIDGFKIFNKALSNEDINALINIGPNDDPDLDSDNDGMEDWWELTYFDDLSLAPDSDSDNDGVKAIVEFNLRSDPSVNDLPGPGIHYEYDALGRIKKIYRIPRR